MGIRWATLALLVQTVISSVNYLVTKAALATVNPIALVSLRIAGAAIFMLPFIKMFGPLKPMSARLHWQMVGLGLLGTALNQTMFFWGLAQPGMKPAHAALLYALTGPLVYFFNWSTGEEAYDSRRIWGIALAVLGAAAVMVEQGLDVTAPGHMGWIITGAGVICWSWFTILSHRVVKAAGTLRTSLWSIFYGALLYLPVTAYQTAHMNWAVFTLPVIGALVYLIIMNSCAALALRYYAATKVPASQVALYITLQPPLTALLAWIVLSDPITPAMFLGTALVVFGVWFSYGRGDAPELP